MRIRLTFFALWLAAAPAWAQKTWYDHYDKGVSLVGQKKYADALKELQAAVAIRPESGTDIRTYGMGFTDYFPYYYQGICHQELGDHQNAMVSFRTEAEKQKEIQKDRALSADLRRRQEQIAQAAARQLRQMVQQFQTEARELAGARKYDEALAALAQAIRTAELLDMQTKRALEQEREELRQVKQKAEERAARDRDLAQALAEAKRFLEDGHDSKAADRFRDVLAMDPSHPEALAGRSAAEDSIRARTTQAERQNLLEEGQAEAAAGNYDAAVLKLTDAAADGRLPAAREELERVRRIQAGIRDTKDRSQRVSSLFADGQRLLKAKKFADALVRFEGVLALDAGNFAAQESYALGWRLMGEAIQDLFVPPQAPELIFTEPSAVADIKGPLVIFDGFATDDRSIERVEFHVGGQLVKHLEPRVKSLALHERLEMPLGTSDVLVRAVDSHGKSWETTFRVTRHRQVHEQPWFFPAAGLTSIALVGLGFGAQRVRRRHAIRRRFNPYIAGAPILNDDMFYGRQKLLSRILNVLHHNSLMITGERRIGKTTLLYQLKKALEADDTTDYRFFPVFIDLQGVDENAFFHSVMADVVETLHPSPDAALHFRDVHEGAIPGSPAAEPEAPPTPYDGRDFSHDLQRIVEELKRRTPKKVKLALLIDEVDVLNAFSERINQRLRSIFMKTFSEHLGAIMSGV